jgi:BASS family bile acid:Na+ symporter
MHIIVPLFAVFMALAFNLTPAVKIALVVLSLSPVPPVLPKKDFKAGAGSEFTFGLLVGAALLSIVIIPLGLAILSAVFGRDFSVNPVEIAKVVSTTVLLPLLAGIVVRHLATGFAERTSDPILKISGITLLIGVIPILFVTGSTMMSLIGNGTLVSMAAMAVLGLVAGHLLGGPNFSDRVPLALASATRHPGVALMLATALFPEQKKLVMAAVLLYVIVSALVSVPYMAWCRKHLTTATA